MTTSFEFSIEGCARCGEDHENMVATPFERPVEMPGEGVKFYHWSTCPKTKEPIIVQGYCDVDRNSS